MAPRQPSNIRINPRVPDPQARIVSTLSINPQPQPAIPTPVAAPEFGQFRSSLVDIGRALGELSPTLGLLSDRAAAAAREEGQRQAVTDFGSMSPEVRRDLAVRKWADFEKSNPDLAGISPFRVIALQEMAARQYARAGYGDKLWESFDEAASAFAEKNPEDYADSILAQIPRPQSSYADPIFVAESEEIKRRWLDQVYAQKRKNIVAKNEEDFAAEFGLMIESESAKTSDEAFGPEFSAHVAEVARSRYNLTKESGNAQIIQSFRSAAQASIVRGDYIHARQIIAGAESYSHNGQVTLGQTHREEIDRLIDMVNLREREDYPKRMSETTVPISVGVQAELAKIISENGPQGVADLKQNPSKIVEMVNKIVADNGLDQQFAGVGVTQAIAMVDSVVSNSGKQTDFKALNDLHQTMTRIDMPMADKMEALSVAANSGTITPQQGEELRRVANSYQGLVQSVGADRVNSATKEILGSFIGYSPNALSNQEYGKYIDIVKTAGNEVLDGFLHEDIPAVTKKLNEAGQPVSEDAIWNAAYPLLVRRSQSKRDALAMENKEWIDRSNSLAQPQAFMQTQDFREWIDSSRRTVAATSEAMAEVVGKSPEFVAAVAGSMAQYDLDIRKTIRSTLPDLVNQYGQDEAYSRMFDILTERQQKIIDGLGSKRSPSESSSSPFKRVNDLILRNSLENAPSGISMSGAETQQSQGKGDPLTRQQVDAFNADAQVQKTRTGEDMAAFNEAKKKAYNASAEFVNGLSDLSGLSTPESMKAYFDANATSGLWSAPTAEGWTLKPDGVHQFRVFTWRNAAPGSQLEYRLRVDDAPNPQATAKWINARIGIMGISNKELVDGVTSEGFKMSDPMRLNPTRARYLSLGQSEDDLASAYKAWLETRSGPLAELLPLLPGFTAEQVIEGQRTILRLKVPTQ